MPIKEALRKAIEQALKEGETLYQIAKQAKVDHAALIKWKATWDTENERDLRVSTASALMRIFKMKIVTETPPKKSPARKAPKR